MLADLGKALLSKRGGVVAILVGAAAAVGAGVVPHDSPEGQAAGAAGLAVLALAAAVGGPKAVAWLSGKLGGGAAGGKDGAAS